MAKKKVEKKELEPRYVIDEDASITVHLHQDDSEDGSQTISMTAVEEPEVITESCNCKDYEGQDFFCKKHDTLTECPGCHTIKTDLEIPRWVYPTKTLRCSICGIFYIRNMETGDYFHK